MYILGLIAIFLWISISNGEVFNINEYKYINENDNINKFTLKENKLYKYSEYDKKNCRGYPFYTVREVFKNSTGGCHDIGWGCKGYIGELKRDLYENIQDFNDFKIKTYLERSNDATKIIDKEEYYEYFQDNCHRQKWNCKGGEIVISSYTKEDYIAVNDEKNLCEIAIHNFEITNNDTQSFSRNIFIYSQILFLTLFFLFTS
ncbi:hypothetical protein U3516DRAFT_748320 [Neocallimastix sp. 'constans']